MTRNLVRNGDLILKDLKDAVASYDAGDFVGFGAKFGNMMTYAAVTQFIDNKRDLHLF
jgi:hypothetical protein